MNKDIQYIPMRIFHYYWNLVSRQWHWLRLALIFFCAGIIGGAGSYNAMPNIQHELADMFQDIIGDSFAFDFTMVVKIFINNSTSALLMIFGGVFLGLIPIFAIFLNGFIIGYVLIGSLLSLPADIIKTVYVSFATILPHGVFEIPAILFSAALGMRFGIEWMQKTSACHRDSMFRKTFIQAVTAVPVLMLILFVAAILEVFVSSRIGYALVNEHPFVWN